MNKQIEAMKLALAYAQQSGFQIGVNEVVTALREALAEQPAQQCKWPTCQSEEYQQALVEQIKRELVGEQPAQQEPVAWLDEEKRIVYLHNTHDVDDYHGFKRTTPLYTSPQPAQRTWVGLTGEEAMNVTRKEGHELLDFIYEYGTGSEGTEERVVAICRAIEAKLKEKNT